MAKKEIEKATQRVRLFPSTHDRIMKRVLKRKGGKTTAQVVDDVEKKATLYEKDQK